MPTLDSNIYGIDETATASEIASDAFGAPRPDGGRIDTPGSRGGGGDAAVSKGSVSVTSKGMSKDSRAVSKGDCPK